MTKSGLTLDNNNRIVSRTEPRQPTGRVGLLLSNVPGVGSTTSEAAVSGGGEVVLC